jgi:hypothetical protein
MTVFVHVLTSDCLTLIVLRHKQIMNHWKTRMQLKCLAKTLRHKQYTFMKKLKIFKY